MAYDDRTRAYITKRTGDGKTLGETSRVLKRYITREVYHHLPSTVTSPDGRRVGLWPLLNRLTPQGCASIDLPPDQRTDTNQVIVASYERDQPTPRASTMSHPSRARITTTR